MDYSSIARGAANILLWQEWGKDFLRIIFTPLILTGMFFAAIYGLYSPYDRRKLYASLERFPCGDTLDRFHPPDVCADSIRRYSFLAPKFQPTMYQNG